MTIPRSRVYRALREASSADDAAMKLGMTQAELRTLAYRLHMASTFLRLEGGLGPGERLSHPKLIDMTDAVLFDGAVIVVARAGNSGNGNARWRVKFVACGHEHVYQGIELRAKRATPECRLCSGRQR